MSLEASAEIDQLISSMIAGGKKASRVRPSTGAIGKNAKSSIMGGLMQAPSRIGQKRRVHVYQLIAENTVEAKVSTHSVLLCIKSLYK